MTAAGAATTPRLRVPQHERGARLQRGSPADPRRRRPRGRPTASSSRSWAGRAPARPPCCGCWAACSTPTPGSTVAFHGRAGRRASRGRGLRLPELRRLAAALAHGRAQRRPSASRARSPKPEMQRAGRRGARHGRPGRPGQGLPVAALGRHAAAGAAGPGAGHAAVGPAHGRALRRPRRHDQGRAAGRAPAGAGADGRHRGLRHPRHRRGRVPQRPHRRPRRQPGHRRPRRSGRPAPAPRPAGHQGAPGVPRSSAGPSTTRSSTPMASASARCDGSTSSGWPPWPCWSALWEAAGALRDAGLRVPACAVGHRRRRSATSSPPATWPPTSLHTLRVTLLGWLLASVARHRPGPAARPVGHGVALVDGQHRGHAGHPAGLPGARSPSWSSGSPSGWS